MAWFRRLWQKALFSEMNPVIQLGEKQCLQAEDLPSLPLSLDPRTEVFVESDLDWSSGPALLKSLMRAHWQGWARPLMYYVANALLILTGPVLVNHFVKRLEAGVQTPVALAEAFAYAMGVGLSGMIAGLFTQHYFNNNLRRIQIVINVVNTKIFRHALSLSKSARERIPVGDIVNHMSTDTDSVSEISGALCDLIYTATVMSGAIVLLFHYLGSTAWAAVILMGVLAPLTRKVSRDFTRFDEDLMKHRDRRVSLMAQILSAIRLVKYFVWEDSVRHEVAAIRSQELAARRRIARAELTVTLLYVSVGTFVLFCVLGLHSWRGGSFDPALIFTCVSLFSLLEDPFAFISRVISVVINAKVGGERIARFLAQPTISTTTGHELAGTESLGFVMRHLSVFLGESRYPSLVDVNLEVRPGESLAIVGPVGSGKSTFIHALLGEIEGHSGELYFTTLNGGRQDLARLGYVPQEAYILNGTLRENLNFGQRHIGDQQIRRALELAGLWHDVQEMPGGLQTEIGEKGINLSGGQRQRLSLARAILHAPQIVVLDDPLSAVDHATEDYLAEHLLFGEWKNTTRVTITHRLHHLEKFDRIAFLEAGRLLAVGSYAELLSACAEFRAYIEVYAHAQTTPQAEAHREVKTLSQNPTRITEDEDREFGAVGGGVYWDYIRSLGGQNPKTRPFLLVLLFISAASGTVFPMLQKIWLATVSNAIHGDKTWLSGTRLETLTTTPIHAVYIYGVLGLLVMAAALTADLFWLQRGLQAGRNIHDKMLRSILGGRMRFFDSTPVGRILQRFSRDMEAIDIQLQWAFEHSMKCFAQVLVTLALILITLPWVAFLIAPVLVLYYRVQRLYRLSAREAKRLDSVSRSPRYAHFKETLQGLVVIRAYGKKEWFLEEFYKRLSHSQRMFYGHFMINRWFSSRIPLIGGLVSLLTTSAVVISVHFGGLTPGVAGLLTVYTLSFWGVLNWGIRIWADVESRMTCMERVKFYSRVAQEQQIIKPALVPLSWPENGEVTFDDVVLRYADHLPQVLRGLSFTVPAATKAGIIGRTGSGKSTLIQALYRFTELESGRILIDGVDIAGVPLARLRKALAIIPQDPTLFMGSVRSNLDRYNEYSDEELWRVLDRTSLGEYMRAQPKGLLLQLSENGANLSQGQRQLMCLARALLLRAKIIILDEATASVDVKTDVQVQRILRESCQGVTMLIIAHRLGTVRDCDQVLEISEGKLRRNLKLSMESLSL